MKLKSIIHYYLKVRPFERKLYGLLGVRVFKKYLPGDFKFNSLDDLEKFADFTKTAEGYHTAAAFTLGAIGTLAFINGNNTEATCLSALNIVGNYYPIMAQRYNRRKCEKILERANLEEKLENAKQT